MSAPVARRLAQVLGERLVAVAVHGSAVTGDLVPGFSDLDLRLFTTRPLTPDDAVRMRAALDGADLSDAATLQLGISPATGAPPCLVPGAHAWVHGTPREDVLLDDAALAAAGEHWLRALPGLLAAWSGAGPARAVLDDLRAGAPDGEVGDRVLGVLAGLAQENSAL